MSDDTKSTKIPGPKLHGGHSFETGPGKHKPHDFQHAGTGGSAPKGQMKTGPAPMDMQGHKAKGTSATGTKADAKAEDSGGKASGNRGAVKGK